MSISIIPSVAWLNPAPVIWDSWGLSMLLESISVHTIIFINWKVWEGVLVFWVDLSSKEVVCIWSQEEMTQNPKLQYKVYLWPLEVMADVGYSRITLQGQGGWTSSLLLFCLLEIIAVSKFRSLGYGKGESTPLPLLLASLLKFGKYLPKWFKPGSSHPSVRKISLIFTPYLLPWTVQSPSLSFRYSGTNFPAILTAD